MIFFHFNLIISLLLSLSSSHPLKFNDAITFPDSDGDDDKIFNDIVNPKELLELKVDKNGIKKLLRSSSDLLENRFDDNEEFDDSASDFKPILKFSQSLTNNLVTSRNTSEDFYVDEAVELRYQSGGFYQGDIMLMPDQEKFYFNSSAEESDGDDDEGGFPSRTGLIGKKYRWRGVNGYPTIFYKFWKESEYTHKEKAMIRLAMDDIESSTCIRFHPRSREKDFILIYSGDDCSSFMGKAGGQQLVSLKHGGCFSRGIIIHELVHTIGYDHMQNHSQRDRYVKIVWDNIDEDARYNFDKVDPKKFKNFDTEYDYYSIMHYDPMAFSENGRRTIIPRDKRYRNTIGQRVGLSLGDVDRINNMYEC